ncbi:ankyrin repeat domain-containing protein [Lysobacter firmicutimachus]|uniref:Ankyrin repeat domain-containing protein n=1 Tax=Lysobacter firmicutimachus TaxID=1792846 RepID=A0ABU8D573_9GAMM
MPTAPFHAAAHFRRLWPALLLSLGACAERAPASAPHPIAEPAAMTATPHLEQHFSGPELALAEAAAAGRGDEVRRLVSEERADPNAVSPGGLPLLAWPILHGNADGVAALLDAGADPNRAVPALGTVMVWAAKAERPELLRALLDHGGDANAQDLDRQPLTRVAALAGRWDNVRLLIEHGADIDAPAHGRPGDTVLAYYSRGQFDKAHWLLERGADPGHRLDAAADPERIGAQPVVENVYWWPVDAGKFPQLAQWQQRCQALLAERGLSLPREPAHLRRLRAAQSGGSAAPAVDARAESERRERELRERLPQR